MLAAMNQLAETSHQLKQSVKSTIPRNVLPPKDQDSYNLDFLFKEFFGSLDPYYLGSLFHPAVLDQPNFNLLLQDLSEETRTKILKVVQD